MRKLDDKMGEAEYKMYRAIPAEEIGMENPCHHMSYDEWRKWLEGEISQEEYVTYVMYLKDFPIGHITVAFNIKTDGGNLSYAIRPISRAMGLGVVMLKLVIGEAKLLGIKRLVGSARKTNVASWRMMEECGFTFLKETEWSSKEYELKLS